MKKGFAYGALLALTLAVPATAERIYVPVLGNTNTQVRIANADDVEGPVAARFRDDSGIEEQFGRQDLADLSLSGKAGLITVDAEAALDVDAWTTNRSGGRMETPWFTDEEVYSAGVDVQLDLRSPRTTGSLTVGAANLSEQTASCKATLYAPNGRRSAEIEFEVGPMAVAQRDALAAARRVGSARVQCDQSFYPFGVTTKPGGEQPMVTKGVGPNGSCKVWLTLIRQPNGIYSASTATTVFHEATKGDPKGIICIKAPSQLNIARASFEWDVTTGPWSSRDKSGLHNLSYIFLDRYRSGTVGNVNAAGPNKGFVKFMQNVGMPRGTNTNAKAGYLLQTGQTYHNSYIFDAATKTATLRITLLGVEVANFSKEVKPGNNQTLVIRPFGQGSQAGLAMTAEFGNYLNQHHPEEASIGWKYSNFKLNLIPK